MIETLFPGVAAFPGDRSWGSLRGPDDRSREYRRGVMRTQAVDKEKSRLSAGFQCIHFVDWRLAAALVLLGRVLSLAVRILLLLSGFLPTTLLLAGLLV